MKFKSGDMVVVVWAVPEFRQVIGRILTLTTPCTEHENSWETEPPVYVAPFKKPMSFVEYSLRLIKDGDLTVNEEVAASETV